MAKNTRKTRNTASLQVEQNDHSGKSRLNNPLVGLVDERHKAIYRRGVERIRILKP